MTTCSVTIMQSNESNGIWLAKCYKDGNLDHVQEVSTAVQAQSYADQWLSDQVDNNSNDK